MGSSWACGNNQLPIAFPSLHQHSRPDCLLTISVRHPGNDLYSFYGLLGTKVGMTFQNFRVSREADCDNVNAVSFLWADTMCGNSINAKIVNYEGVEPFLRIDFECYERSWGCNIAIRPQDQKAVERKNQGLDYLYFQARIPEEALQDPNLLNDVGISIRIVNGKYQQWDYASRAGEYVQFHVREDGAWGIICIDVQDRKKWSHFISDGNPHISDDDQNNADLSIISSVIIKVGGYKQSTRGELGSGKGRVDVKDIRFSPDRVSSS
jgi:hypothetical protein